MNERAKAQTMTSEQVSDSPQSVITSHPIGKVVSTRREPVDDRWKSVECHIVLDETRFSADALSGLDGFSHAEVLFFMHKIDKQKIEMSARHPRGRKEWPKAGIFAQRGKNRPNQLGLTICRIRKVEGIRLYVEGLDAIDGTSVLDIKPWVKEFGPQGEVFQPEWMTQLMKEYW
ncbi:MAG: SAM-dependent methyltransferase [Bdellovibrionales bacterium]